jgi:hypothetical protein
MYNLSATLIAIKNQIQHKPVEIYDIYLGSQDAEDSDTLHFINFYRITTFFSYFGHTPTDYIPLGLQRTAIKKTSSGEIEQVSFRVCNINKGMSAYAASKNFRNKRVVARLIFRDNISSYLDTKIIFDGFIQNISFPQKTMDITATPKIGSLSFETGWPYQIECHARFGDSYCKVNKELAANKVIGTATGGTKSTLIDTVNLTQADDYWNWGYVIFSSGTNNGLSRKVVDFDNATKTATLDYPFEDTIEAGDMFTIYRGCDKTLNICDTVYGNTSNYHGFHTIPLTK